MNDTAVITLVVVSAVLVILLILLCVAVYSFIQILKAVRRVVDKAENVAVSVENVASTLENSAGPLAALKVVANIVENATKFKKGKEK